MVNIPKGTKDILPTESYRWRFLENSAREIAGLFNLKEIRTPTFEHTELFLRGIGEATDVVNKEMYTFEDKGGRSITLKPEGTAGVVRCYIEALGSESLPLKMFYFTPVFRYESPQAGRLREHHQFGVELFGASGAEMDAEAIIIAKTFLNKVGVNNLELNINSIGYGESRQKYTEVLKGFLRDKKDCLCHKCQSRIEVNPLRVLDCKEEKCINVVEKAPKTIDYLDEESFQHFEKLKTLLTQAKIEYKVNPKIVRGLDYYTKTVFEFTTDIIGAKSTVCGGGRYDNLIESLGGKATPAVGFGLGLERLLLVLDNSGIVIKDNNKCQVFIAATDEIESGYIINLCSKIRYSGYSADYDQLRRSVKAQFKFANKQNAKVVIVIGGEEYANRQLKIKNMSSGEEYTIDEKNIITTLDKETERVKV